MKAMKNENDNFPKLHTSIIGIGSHNEDSIVNESNLAISDSKIVVSNSKNPAIYFGQNEDVLADNQLNINSTNEHTENTKSSSNTKTEDTDNTTSESTKKEKMNLPDTGCNLVLISLERKKFKFDKPPKKVDDEYKKFIQKFNRKLASDIYPKKVEFMKIVKKYKIQHSHVNEGLFESFYEVSKDFSSDNSDREKRESLITNYFSTTFMYQFEMLNLIKNYELEYLNNGLGLIEHIHVMKGLGISDINQIDKNLLEKKYLEFQAYEFIKFVQSNFDHICPFCIYQKFYSDIKQKMNNELFHKEIDNLFKLSKSENQGNIWLYKPTTNEKKEKINKLFMGKISLDSITIK